MIAAFLRINFICLVTVALIGGQPTYAQSTPSKPKNIIILFADGTTNSQYEFGRYSSAQLRQQSFAIIDEVMANGHH